MSQTSPDWSISNITPSYINYKNLWPNLSINTYIFNTLELVLVLSKSLQPNLSDKHYQIVTVANG